MRKRKTDVWNDPEEKMTRILTSVLFAVEIVVVVAIILFGITSCKTTSTTTKERVVERDTVTICQHQRDSIYVHDSVFYAMSRIADTVYVTREKWHTAYRDRILHDSIYIAKTDTIYLDREKVVEKHLTWWQNTGLASMLIFLIMLATFLLKRWYR